MLRKYREWQRGEFVVVGADTAAGGLDYCTAVFISKTNLDTPLIYHSKVIATEMTPILHLELERIYDKTGVKPVVAPETNNGGTFEIERLAKLNRNGKYIIFQQKRNIGTTNTTEDTVKLGWTTTSANRPTMLQMLKECIDNRLLQIYDKPLVNEMFAFIISQTSSSWKAQAEQGAHDDLIMALAIAWQLYQSENPFVKPVRTRQPRKRVSLHL